MKLLKDRKIQLTLFLVMGLLATPLAAQTPAPPKANPAAAAPPPSDPFIKKDAPPVDVTGPVSNIILTFESYTLSQANGAKLLQEIDTDEARHDQLLELVKSGQAHLDAVLCGALKSGDQFIVEQVDNMAYAISFKYGPGKLVTATDYKKRNVGRRLVYKGQETSDHQGYDGSIFLEQTTLNDFINTNVDNGIGDYYTSQPVFSTRRVNAKPPLFAFDQIRFLGTYSPMPKASWLQKAPASGAKAEDSEMTLVFEKATKMQLDPGTLKEVKPVRLELQMSIYSMDRDKALQFLNQKQEMDSAYQAVQSLVKTNQAKLEHLSVLRTVTGVKSNVDEVNELVYTTGASDQFIDQDVGFSAEIKPFFPNASPFLAIDVTKFQLLSYVGELHTAGAAPYNQSQPVFAIQSLVTQINSALGEHELLGTISPPDNTGAIDQKDTGRVWLAFLQTTAVNP